ncbi:methyltransferase [Sansalvadorimonas sp. 2012CJ34-2]|uniref:Ribosomal RNA small subunit methyltransferase C n=1 Tax=Parendozoicomonas callyspongiae TaxID=2942213 RepID=A0ABT0PKT4_9GAMM|nr:methyltransferase [Sansalvadorimonas sp. 2012CJ34-2]MCL6271881.1 methyltransferase [Sansalvadorimonas sp. 2012CJ34-2]
MSSLTNPSRLLLRNIEELDVSRLLLAMPPADSVIDELAGLPETEVHVFTTLLEVQQHAQRSLSHEHVTYAHQPRKPDVSFDGVVLFLQKSRPLVEAMLEQLCPLLGEEGYLLLVGENGSGIKSWKKRLGQFGEVEVVDSACHSGLVRLCPSADMQSGKGDLEQTTFQINVAGKDVEVVSLPGVFSHGRLDIGTQLLLETLSSEVIRGKVLDFGCGAGVIGSWLGLRHKRCRPYLLDADALAVEASRRTLASNQLQGEVIASHGLSEVKGKYDWIISNPPFHDGVKTRYDVTEEFLRQSRDHLVNGGQLRIVANNFLRYRPLIEEAFGHCEELARGNGFVIYGATAGRAFQSASF